MIPEIGQDWSESQLGFTGGCVSIKYVCVCACVSMWTCMYRDGHWEYGVCVEFRQPGLQGQVSVQLCCVRANSDCPGVNKAELC